MNFKEMNPNAVREQAQKQYDTKTIPDSSVEEDAILSEQTLLEKAKIRWQRYQNITIRGAICIFIGFALIALIFILSVALIHFLGPDKYTWLGEKRLGELKLLLTGGAGTLIASIAFDTIRDKK